MSEQQHLPGIEGNPKRRYRARAMGLADRQCAHCGSPFQPQTAWAKFCSPACKNKVVAVRAKERYAASAEHRARVRAHNKRWREENKEKCRIVAQARTLRMRDHSNRVRMELYRRDRLARPWLALLTTALDRSKKRKVPFSLTPEWAEARWTGKCEISGIEFELGRTRASPRLFSPSIDRIIPALGYVPENCRFILFGINAMKADGTTDEMIAICKAVANRNA